MELREAMAHREIRDLREPLELQDLRVRKDWRGRGGVPVPEVHRDQRAWKAHLALKEIQGPWDLLVLVGRLALRDQRAQ